MVDSYFSSNDFDSSGLFPAPGFGRHGINKNRALVLLRSAHLSDGPMQPGTDPHWFIDGPLAEFNEHMQASLRPSHLGCIDETGCLWRGGESEGDFKDCPHITVVKRKPEPIVAEFNDVCCASSCIMMKMEFEKAAKYHKATEHFDLTGTYNQFGGEAGLSAWLANPGSPTMAPIFADQPMSEEEISSLVAFLAEAPDREEPADSVDWLLLAGVVGVGVLLAGMAIAWRGMRRPYAQTLTPRTRSAR